jgi:prepilin signal peptidase PulO-like enzyme (type II secretory pathway)
MQDKNGKVIAYSAYYPNTGKNIIMKHGELSMSGFTIAISARTQILPLALINPCIILIVVINKLLISLYFCWCVA